MALAALRVALAALLLTGCVGSFSVDSLVGAAENSAAGVQARQAPAAARATRARAPPWLSALWRHRCA